MSRLTKEQHKIAHLDKKHWTEADEVSTRFQSKFRYMKGGRIKLGRSEKKSLLLWKHDIEDRSIKVPDNIKKWLYKDVKDFDEVRDVINQLMRVRLRKKNVVTKSLVILNL